MIISLPPLDAELGRLGARMREVREARGLSLSTLSAETRISAADLSLAEHGRARLTSTQVHALTSALHVSPRILFEPGLDVSGLRRL